MPFQVAQDNTAQVILQSAQIVLQSINQQNQFKMQLAHMEAQQKQWREKVKLDNEILDLREEELTLKQQTEKRLQKSSDDKTRLAERGLDIRESLGMEGQDLANRRLSLDQALGKRRLDIQEGKAKKLDTKTAAENARLRKAQMQEIEEEAALRADAPQNFQNYSDTSKLIQYRKERNAALARFKTSFVPDDDPQVKATKAELTEIDAELLERAKYKRRTMLDMGIASSLTQTRNHLPDLVQETPDDEDMMGPLPSQSSTSSFDFNDQAVFSTAVKSALGQDPTFESSTAAGSLRSEHARLKSDDPTGSQSKQFRLRVYNSLPAKNKAERDTMMNQLNLR